MRTTVNSAGAARRPAPRDGEAGFTLIEALIAMVILVFGLIAVSNLLFVAASSNRVAGDSTAAANVAQQQLETLRALPYGTVDGQVGATQVAEQFVDGVGWIDIEWDVLRVDPGGPVPPNPAPLQQLLFINLRAESRNPVARARSRAEYTVFRACTLPGC